MLKITFPGARYYLHEICTLHFIFFCSEILWLMTWHFVVDPVDHAPWATPEIQVLESHSWDVWSGGSSILVFCFIVGSWRFYTLSFGFEVGSWRSWILHSFYRKIQEILDPDLVICRGTCRSWILAFNFVVGYVDLGSWFLAAAHVWSHLDSKHNFSRHTSQPIELTSTESRHYFTVNTHCDLI